MLKNYVKFDISFYIVTLLAISLGFLTQYVILAVTILVHEAGHLVMAAWFRWELTELKFIGFGGTMQYKGELNKSNKENIIVSMGGISFNVIFLLILLCFKEMPMTPVQLKKYQYLVFAQLFVICFNLLPLPPLDGNRILNAILCCFLPYKKVLKIISISNVVILSGLILATFLYNFQQFPQYAVIFSFLIYSTRKYHRQKKYVFQRFLLQKNLYRSTALPIKNVNISNDSWEDCIYRGYHNYFQVKNYSNDEIKWLKLKYRENPEVMIDAQFKRE